MDELHQTDPSIFNTLYEITHPTEDIPYEKGKHSFKEIKDLHIKNGKYTLKGIFTFETDKGELTLTAEDTIEIAYALFDWAGIDYSAIENIEDRRNKGEL